MVIARRTTNKYVFRFPRDIFRDTNAELRQQSKHIMHSSGRDSGTEKSNFQPSQQSNPSYPQEVAQPDRQTIEPNITNPAVAGHTQSISILDSGKVSENTVDVSIEVVGCMIL